MQFKINKHDDERLMDQDKSDPCIVLTVLFLRNIVDHSQFWKLQVVGLSRRFSLKFFYCSLRSRKKYTVDLHTSEIRCWKLQAAGFGRRFSRNVMFTVDCKVGNSTHNFYCSL